MTHEIEFHIEGHGKALIDIHRGIIAGWTGRNADAVNHHIAELWEIGVPPPSTVPLFYRVSASLFTTDQMIETVDATSSGEAEPVLVDDGTRLYLGLGSDHTDRSLETHSVALSKQICAKPVAPVLWPFEEVEGHLDEIQIRSFVRDDAGSRWVPYQDGTLASIRPLGELVASSPAASGALRLNAGTAMMCGTFAVLSGGVRPSRYFRMEMVDDRLGRTIDHCYEMSALPVIS
ncbi:DUF2848 domain-containing protein [Rhizobium halophilum]|uniref:DUF2848 domain-containing protein n=1 Tax=Rhizobium halophilum TaxID=2846852 RepID=UPI001EFE60B6|nr:DUF2848 domain-containing protein [Rhizobium halophilum]MCF6370823.1 DUF2848 domain-containing protein [Rhizobium halophilum]